MDEQFKKWFGRGAVVAFYTVRIAAVCLAAYLVYSAFRMFVLIYF